MMMIALIAAVVVVAALGLLATLAGQWQVRDLRSQNAYLRANARRQAERDVDELLAVLSKVKSRPPAVVPNPLEDASVDDVIRAAEQIQRDDGA